MPERVFDQAAGLSGLGLQPPTRVLPVVQSAVGSASLELMWRLEQVLRHMKLPVAVVEGCHGLQVRDARQGYRQVLARWLDGVPSGSVVLLHAPLEALAVLLADSTARPLLALNEQPRSLVEVYNALKVLWQVSRLNSVVLDTGLTEPGRAAQVGARSAALQASCEQHLDWVPVLWWLGYDQAQGGELVQSEEDCVLKVLDTALLLEESESRFHVPLPQHFRSNPAADQIVGVSDVHRQRHARPGCPVAQIQPAGA